MQLIVAQHFIFIYLFIYMSKGSLILDMPIR